MLGSRLYKNLIEAIDVTLKDYLGDAVAQVFYAYLKKKHGLKKENIPKRVSTFSSGLEDFFGLPGAEVIESIILRTAFKKMKINIKEGGTFVEIMKEISKKYCQIERGEH